MRQNVRLSDLPSRLQAVLETENELVIALRVDGDDSDANMLISTTAVGSELWRVCVQGFRYRAHVWNIVRTISDATCGPWNPFPEDVQRQYEHGINTLKSGWIVLTVQNGEPKVLTARCLKRPL